MLLIEGADPFNPLFWREPEPDESCYISLSDRLDCHVLLDRQDYEWARAHLWCHTYGAGPMQEIEPGVLVMARPNHIYARRCTGGKTLWLHREILLRAVGPPPYLRGIGDHKNGDTLDCRRRNLRWATPRMNARNTPKSKVRAKFLKQMGAR